MLMQMQMLPLTSFVGEALALGARASSQARYSCNKDGSDLAGKSQAGAQAASGYGKHQVRYIDP